MLLFVSSIIFDKNLITVPLISSEDSSLSHKILLPSDSGSFSPKRMFGIRTERFD